MSELRPDASGRYVSPDGQWLWDGGQWVPNPDRPQPHLQLQPAHHVGFFQKRAIRKATEAESQLGAVEILDGEPVTLTGLSKLALALVPLQKAGGEYLQAAGVLQAEIARRQAALLADGHDSIYARAIAQHGMAPPTVTVALKKGEETYFNMLAQLARYRTRTKFVGGSQGVSIPLGHGIRYRTGRFQGHPVSTQELVIVDSGDIVVTSQRLMFLGAQKSVVFDLAKIIQLSPGASGFSISRQGKESLDYYVCDGEEFLARFYAADLLDEAKVRATA